MNTTDLIQKIANEKAATTFSDDYIRPDNLEERQEEGLGIAISQWAQWDGVKVMRVFAAALEDANYHAEAAQVQEMIKSAGDVI